MWLPSLAPGSPSPGVDGISFTVHPLDLSCPLICTCAALIASEVTRPLLASSRAPLVAAPSVSSLDDQQSKKEELCGETRARLRALPAGWSAPHLDGQSVTCSCAARPRVPAASPSRHARGGSTCHRVPRRQRLPASLWVRRTGRPAAVEVHAEERRRGLISDGTNCTAMRAARPPALHAHGRGAAYL